MQSIMISMLVVTFIFHSDVSPEQQETILNQINRWESVQKVTHLNPNATHPELLRMCNAYLVDRADQVQIVKKLMDIPEIELAEIPAKRSLIN